jgi:dsRNA-specific ribonuclease
MSSFSSQQNVVDDVIGESGALKALQQRIGYQFVDIRTAGGGDDTSIVCERARESRSNERLEHLGDAVLGTGDD